MKKNLLRFISITALICSSVAFAKHDSATSSDSCSSCPTGCTQSQNLAQIHPFTASSARNIKLTKAAWYPKSDEEGWHGTFGVGVEYDRNTGEKCNVSVKKCCTSLGSMPWWAADKSNQMKLGSNTSGSDLDVYQLGMGPVTTTGTVTLKPFVYQAGADFSLYVGANKTERGFFLKAHAPVGVISINPMLSYSEDLTPVDYPAGSLGIVSAGVTPAPYKTIADAFKGDKSAGFLQKMVYGRIDCKHTSSAHFGDFEGTIGYNFVADEKKHLGIGLAFSAPTGNKAEAINILEPIFGRNGHWGAGGQMIGHWRFWESDNDQKYADLWLDATVFHLFRSNHMRSFDLQQNGLGSKYLLIADYTGNTFQNKIQNAINITTVGVESTFAAEGNFALGFDFHWNNWSMMLGYEGWGRTCEKLSLDCACSGTTNFNNFAVLGRQLPFSNEPCPDQVAVNDLCQPLATIGTSLSPAALCVDALPATSFPTGIALATVPANRIPDEADKALNIDGQRAHAAYSSKPFAQVQYTWTDSDYSPFLAVSGGAEISHTQNSAVNFWNIGVEGGISF